MKLLIQKKGVMGLLVILLFFISVIIHSWIYRIFRPFFTPLFFNRFVIIHYLCTHMFLSFIHRYITHKRKPSVPENSRDEKAYFRGTTLVHPTGPGKLFCSCILIRPNALIHSITGIPAFVYLKFNERTPRWVHSLRFCLAPTGSSLNTIHSYYSSSMFLQYPYSL